MLNFFLPSCLLSFGTLVAAPVAPTAPAAQPPPAVLPFDRIYQPPGEPWLVQIPDGWIRADDAMVTDLNDAARQQFGDRAPQYLAAFVAEPEDGSYALLQLQPGMPPGASYADIQTGFDVSPENILAATPNESIADVLKTMTFGQSTLDTTRNRVVRGFEVTQPDGHKLKATTVNFLGADKIVSLHCYAPEEAFTAKQPAFQELFDGFHFNPGASFVPGPGLGTGFSYVRILIAAAIGAGAAFLIAAVKYGAGKRRSADARPVA